MIADPHQQTPTPSEKAAKMLGITQPRRRIVASNNKNPNFKGNGLYLHRWEISMKIH